VRDRGRRSTSPAATYMMLGLFQRSVVSIPPESIKVKLDRAPDRAATQLDCLQELAQGALAEMRSLIHQLRPSTAAEAGLISALRQHVAQRKRQDGLTVDLRVEGVDNERLSPAQEETLFRIVQEALNNVVKYAQTDRAEVTLRLVPESVTLAMMTKSVSPSSA
jgi:signal transduction histidine kinase